LGFHDRRAANRAADGRFVKHGPDLGRVGPGEYLLSLRRDPIRLVFSRRDYLNALSLLSLAT
jgi:hypothetical protein